MTLSNTPGPPACWGRKEGAYWVAEEKASEDSAREVATRMRCLALSVADTIELWRSSSHPKSNGTEVFSSRVRWTEWKARGSVREGGRDAVSGG